MASTLQHSDQKTGDGSVVDLKTSNGGVIKDLVVREKGVHPDSFIVGIKMESIVAFGPR